MAEDKQVTIEDLTFDDKNFNKHTEFGMSLLEKSLRNNGAGRSILIDKNNRIIGGNGVVEAAGQIGLNNVRIVESDGTEIIAVKRTDIDLDSKQGREMALADNATSAADLAWDEEQIQFAEEEFGVVAEEWGVHLDFEAEQPQATEDDFDESTDATESKCKKGEVWQLGEHRLMCGDSTSADDVAKLMDGNKADMVLSDPPYGMFLDTDFSTIKGSSGSIGRKKHIEGKKYKKVIGDNEDFSPTLIKTFFDNFGYCKEIFLFGADYYAELLPNKNEGSWLVWDKRKESQADAIGAEFELLWSRNKHKRRMLRHDWFGFVSSNNNEDARNRVHPTQKPVTLITDIIIQWGKDADLIVDLYGGSGSTLIACEQLSRKCFMMELDPHYCDVIIARWEKLTGKTARRITDGL